MWGGKLGLSFGCCLIDGTDPVCLSLANGGRWWKTRAGLRKNCIQWFIDVFFVHSHLITVASVIRYNKTENPINSPSGAVMMVSVYRRGELISGFSQAGGYCICWIFFLSGKRCWLCSFKGRKQHENQKKARLKVANSSRECIGSIQFNFAWQFTS